MTYQELNRNEMGWIASHVAGDMLAMNDPQAEVSTADLAKIEDARKRDSAVATFPPESRSLFGTMRRTR